RCAGQRVSPASLRLYLHVPVSCCADVQPSRKMILPRNREEGLLRETSFPLLHLPRLRTSGAIGALWKISAAVGLHSPLSCERYPRVPRLTHLRLHETGRENVHFGQKNLTGDLPNAVDH